MFHVVYVMSYIIHGFILFVFLCGIVIKCEKFLMTILWKIVYGIIAYLLIAYIHTSKAANIIGGKKTTNWLMTTIYLSNGFESYWFWFHKILNFLLFFHKKVVSMCLPHILLSLPSWYTKTHLKWLVFFTRFFIFLMTMVNH